MPMPITPLARGLYLCGRVTVDPRTHNLTLVSCFRAMRADRFPALTRPFFVVAHLVNGLGEFTLRVGIVRLDTGQPVYQYGGEVSFGDRLNDLRFTMQIGQFAAPITGSFGVMLWANDELIAQTDFTVLGPAGDTP